MFIFFSCPFFLFYLFLYLLLHISFSFRFLKIFLYLLFSENGHLLQSEVENPRLLVKLVVQITQKIQHCLLTTTKREPSWPAKKSSWQSWLPIWSPFWSAQDLGKTFIFISKKFELNFFFIFTASGCLKRGSMKKLLKSLCRKKK